MALFIFTVGLISVPSDSSEISSANLFGKFYFSSKNSEKLAFTYERKANRLGDLVEVTFKDSSGAEAAREILRYQNGALVTYEMEQLQTGEKSLIKISEKSVEMQYSSKKKKLKKNKFKRPREFIVPPQIPDFVKANLSKLTNGKRVKTKIGIPHVNTYYTFVVSSMKSKKGWFVFKPANFFVSLLAPNLEVQMDVQSGKLLGANGPTLLYYKKKTKDKKWKAFTGRAEFSQPKKGKK